ncbi:MAG: serine/threonine protein kinase [Sedimentisphaerales bacterium]|nr:serine/threonine protein kinase [Sedimentisphaerales bacterium]
MAETNVDSILGRIVVDKQFCTDAEVRECFDVMKNLARQGRPHSLSDALLAQGYITQSQLDRLNQHIDEARPTHRIPGFQILEKLGAGAMATVFKAKQLSLDRIVAIKVLPKRLSENPEYVVRFYKEGKAAAKLNHTNIVQAIDVGEAGGFHYFVMEYVEGKTVYDDLAKGLVYSETDALDIIIQIAEALEHAHERGLIHRDVKPKNVMITSDGIAKLADMGLAREAADQEAAQMEAGRAYGTPYYISPEQIRGELDIGFQADIYSLGAMFYHMVTGRVPFEAPTPSAVMHKHLKEQLVPPDHLNTELSVGVAEVIEVMMAKKPDERYLSVKLLLEDLRNIQSGGPPLHAHRKFDPHALVDLEKSSPGTDVTLENVLENNGNPEDLGTKILIIVLSGLLLVAILFIIVLMSKPN